MLRSPLPLLAASCTALLLSLLPAPSSANWNDWWTYDGISGPKFWGVMNPDWHMCNKGMRQSPVNLRTDAMVFDKTLEPVRVDKQPVAGVLYNTGQSLMFRADTDRVSSLPVNITGGPLSYRYQFEQLFLRWGDGSAGSNGSEHAVDSTFFPGEIQLYGFNAHLFRNLSQALQHPHGVVGIALMVQELDADAGANAGGGASRTLSVLTSYLKKVMYKGQNFPVPELNVHELMPSTNGYMTYEGSLTYPGCWESVTWIVMNRPVYITRRELDHLRQLMQGDKINPKAPLAENVRSMQDLNGRTIRTNINFGPALEPAAYTSFASSKATAASKARTKGKTKRRDGVYGFPKNKTGKRKGGKSHHNVCPDLAREVYYTANVGWN